MNSSITSTIWYDQQAWALESETHRIVVVPVMGAKIVSLRDMRDGFEWLVGPGNRPVKPVAYGALWHEQDMAGWDEMFPTIVSCPYPGAGPRHGTPLPDHGEAWTLPWAVVKATDGELSLTLQGRFLPYRLTRSIDFLASDVLRLRYKLANLTPEPMPYIWAAHPQFVAGLDGEIILPAEITEVINTIPEAWGWGPPETRFDWPEATALDGHRVRLDQVGSPTLRKGRKLFVMPTLHPSWAMVLRRQSGHWLRFEWNPAEIPYLGLWVDEGALNHESVVALEPTTGWYDNLEFAYQKGEVTIVSAGGLHEWTLIVRLGTGGFSSLG